MEIYLDNAAATPIDPRVARVITETLKVVGNPSSYNDAGRKVAQILEDSRKKVARFLGAHTDEIIFTGSGSEANNLALNRRGEILTSAIEHHSVLHAARGKKNIIKVDATGRVDLDGLVKKLNKKITLVSVMYANNEIGTIEPIAKIGKIIATYRRQNKTKFPYFHTDACQATSYLDMNVNNLGVDLLTLNSTKIYGPAGAAVLYVRRGTPIVPLVLGGNQERGRRAGTENVPAIAGLAKAVELIKKDGGIIKLRDYFLTKLGQVLPTARVNGPLGQNCLDNNINISIHELTSEQLLLELDKYGVRASSGAACTARSVEPSHVLKAIGVKKPYLDGAIRFSLGRQNSKQEIDFVLKILPKIVSDLKKRYGLKKV